MSFGILYSALWIFILFSVLGWAVDTVSASIQKKGIIDRGFLVGPVCPMYGFLFSGAYLLDIFVFAFCCIFIFCCKYFFQKIFQYFILGLFGNGYRI